jgi:hypothetical protein
MSNTVKPLAGPKPEVMLDLRTLSTGCLVSIALAMRADHCDHSHAAYSHILNWLSHKGMGEL